MNPQPESLIFISLGSNLGNRMAHLQEAVDLLFQEIGTIGAISPVYESPAVGFQGEPFLNCALIIYSSLNPLALIEAILEIEKRMGRMRNASQTYSSRPIDIDIVFIDDLVLEEEALAVPHPRMISRKFVLQPIYDLDAEKNHPIIKKSIKEILSETTDDTPLVRKPEKLTNPIQKYSLANHNYIAIEGNIGAGKTSLATKLSRDFNAKLILERFKDNPFLPKFYEDAPRYAFPLEMSFLADRYQQMVEDISQFDLFADLVISDYDVNKSLIFASITLPEEEYALYRKLFQIMQKELPQPDIYIYLHQNTERLLENIKKRGRSYEQSIQAEYLRKLNVRYLDFVKSKPAEKLKIIDIAELDFIDNRSDYLQILKEISS